MSKCNSDEETCYKKKNRDVIQYKGKDYYENDKEKLRQQARDKHRNLSEEEKIKRENMKETIP